MHWNDHDAKRFTKKADTPEKQKYWALMANTVFSNTGDEIHAIRVASRAVKDIHETINGRHH